MEGRVYGCLGNGLPCAGAASDGAVQCALEHEAVGDREPEDGRSQVVADGECHAFERFVGPLGHRATFAPAYTAFAVGEFHK